MTTEFFNFGNEDTYPFIGWTLHSCEYNPMA